MDDFTLNPTNTFASTNFDVLHIDGVEDPLIDINKLATIDITESYFSSSVDFLKSYNEEYNQNKAKLYSAISEATNTSVVLESFSEFFVKSADVIEKFFAFLDNMSAKHYQRLFKLHEEESEYFKANRSKFDQFTDADAFVINGFNFTLDNNYPVPDAISSYNRTIFEGLYGTADGALNLDTVKTGIQSVDLQREFDEFRGRVLGTTDHISIAEFGSELFKVFRNGASDSGNLVINKKALNEYLQYKPNHDNSYNDLKKAFNKLLDEIKEIVARNGDLNANAFVSGLPEDSGINRIDGVEVNGIRMSDALMTHLDYFTKAKVELLEGFTNIYILAYGARFDAERDEYVQNKNILYTALNKINFKEQEEE